MHAELALLSCQCGVSQVIAAASTALSQRRLTYDKSTLVGAGVILFPSETCFDEHVLSGIFNEDRLLIFQCISQPSSKDEFLHHHATALGKLSFAPNRDLRGCE